MQQIQSGQNHARVNSADSSARIYWENRERDLISAAAQKTNEISIPVATTVFPEEVYRAPETWARRECLVSIRCDYLEPASDEKGGTAKWQK